MASKQTALLLLAFLGYSAIANAQTTEEDARDKVVVCYYGSWAVYRPYAGKFDVEDIDPFLCTHAIYGFSGLSSYKGLMVSLDPFNDLYDNNGKGAYERFTKLKERNPELKTLLAVGGWNEGSTKFSLMVSTAEGRNTFLVNAVDFLKTYGFDGLDIDWEYPALRGGDTEDKANFAALLAEMRTIFDDNGLMMTAAVSGDKRTIDSSYDIPMLAKLTDNEWSPSGEACYLNGTHDCNFSKYLDHIHVMCYDYHGAWDPFTGHNAPLYWGPLEGYGQYIYSNANYSIHYWIENGAPKEKIVMGMPFYGRTFTLDDESYSGPYAPAMKPGIAGPYTRERGTLGYNEICDQMKASPSSWEVTRDPYYMAPYAVNGKQWVGYDDAESIKIKALFAADMDLKGAMVWSIDTDDFRGGCHGKKFPLLNAIWEGLNGGVIPTPPQTPPTDMPTMDPTATLPTKEPTPSTTTTSRPTPPPTEICQEEGLNRDPTDCGFFYLCTPGKYGKWQVVKYRCGPGTVYDPANKVCNWPYAVPGCEDYPGGRTASNTPSNKH